MNKTPNLAEMVDDLGQCGKLLDALLAERNQLREENKALRAGMVLWHVKDVDDGETIESFLAPREWAPGKTLQEFLGDNDLRIVRDNVTNGRVVPVCTTDEQVRALRDAP